MRIWLIEDDEVHARDAAECVVSVAKRLGKENLRSLELYWDPAMKWKPNFRLMNETRSEAPADASEEPPDIVILDLFDSDLRFAAEDFLRSLRKWEFLLDASRRPSWVILWSVNPGREEVTTFLDREPLRDNRVVALQTKGLRDLSEKLLGCWQSWEEERFP